MIARTDAKGVTRSHPLPFHGPKTPIPKGILKDIIRKFDLPEDVFDAERRT